MLIQRGARPSTHRLSSRRPTEPRQLSHHACPPVRLSRHGSKERSDSGTADARASLLDSSRYRTRPTTPCGGLTLSPHGGFFPSFTLCFSASPGQTPVHPCTPYRHKSSRERRVPQSPNTREHETPVTGSRALAQHTAGATEMCEHPLWRQPHVHSRQVDLYVQAGHSDRYVLSSLHIRVE